MTRVYTHGVMKYGSHPQAKLYWRVKEDGKWKWIPAKVNYEGAHHIMVYWMQESEEE